MINIWLEQIAAVLGNNPWIAPLLALLAGVLTSVTPCSLSGVPLIIGYVGGVGEKNTKKAFTYSVIFSLGTAFTFVLLGILASSLSILMGKYMTYWYLFLGIVMVLMALQTWEIFDFIPSSRLLGKNKRKVQSVLFLPELWQVSFRHLAPHRCLSLCLLLLAVAEISCTALS